MVNLKTLRPSPALQRFASKYLLPLIGSTDPPRRGNRVFPDEAPNPRRVTTTPSGSRSRTGMGTTPSTETRSQSPTVHSPLSLSKRSEAQPQISLYAPTGFQYTHYTLNRNHYWLGLILELLPLATRP